MKNCEKDPKKLSTYFTDLTVDIKVLDTDHPVSQGLSDFTMTDAYYGNIYMDPGVHSLLGTDHSDIASVIAWTHVYQRSKVVCMMPGFAKGAYENSLWIRVVVNSLRYVGCWDFDYWAATHIYIKTLSNLMLDSGPPKQTVSGR